MPPILALSLWLVLLLALLFLDPAKDGKTSPVLWLPVIWIFIVATRLPSQWLGLTAASQVEAFESGNPLDRLIFSIFIVVAIGVLFSRHFRWGSFLSGNPALLMFLVFALVSVIWSDVPFIALKRWIRDLGTFLMILVILSDPQPLRAICAVLRRLTYLIITLSILLIKYYPQIGIQYSPWTGGAMAVGPTTSKNGLGAVCLVSGLFLFWDTWTRWLNRKTQRSGGVILVNLVFLIMTFWLLNLANSATSRVCLALGCFLVFAIESRWGKKHPRFFKVLIPASFLMYVVLGFGFDINGYLASQVGRDPTLTDRTLIWQILLDMHTNPVIGTGYESFWAGPRLLAVWSNKTTAGLNEAHNGYLETYLNLGMVGVVILIWFLIVSYRHLCKKLDGQSHLASLGLALWTISLFYNMTEAAFKWHYIWIAFLFGAVAIADCVDNPEPSRAMAEASHPVILRTTIRPLGSLNAK